MNTEEKEWSEEDAVAYREKLVAERESGKNPDAEEIPAELEEAEILEDQQEGEQKHTELDPVVKAALDDIKAKLGSLDNLSYRLKQAEGRLGSVQNAVQNANSAAEKAARMAKEAPTVEQVAAASKTDEEWEEAKAEFPELEVLERRIASKEVKQEIPDVAAIRAELETDFTKKLTATQQAFETRLLDISRKGWRETAKSQEMKEWIAAQDEETQRKYYKSDKADDAIEVLDAFDEHRKKSQEEDPGKKTPEQIMEERNKRLGRSLSVKGRGQPTKTKAVEEMTDDEYRAFKLRLKKSK